MRDAVRGLPRQLEEGLELAVEPPVSRGAIDSLIVVGMGGSAIGADMLVEWLWDRLEVPVAVLRGERLPRWVGEKTLVVAVSYSGNTRETLTAAASAIEGGHPLVAITSDGRLAELCQDAIPLIRVPGGLPPRAALGYLLSTSARLVEELGLADTSRDVLEGARELQEALPGLAQDADRLAEALEGTLPTVYGHPPFTSVARRWAAQLNENAKLMAWWGELPEGSHNQVEGWSGSLEGGPLAAIFLRDPGESPTVARFMDEVTAVVSREAACHTATAVGETRLGRMLTCVALGDLLSLELAERRGMEPLEVPVIEAIKNARG